MSWSSFAPALGIALALVVPAAAAPASLEIKAAAQPQLATAGGARVYVAYGQGQGVFVARSEDNGSTFGPAVRVATPAGLMLGMRRGPRITADGDDVTVTLIAEELVAYHSSDRGRTWAGPTTLNSVPRCAREGLHDLARGPGGQVFVTWLDLRNGKMELWGATSRNGGRTWGPNERVYRSPDVSICECCHPVARFDPAGNLAVMWRNSIGGARDMWMTTRPAGAAAFGPARKLGEETWTLKACPMDGGDVLALGGGSFAAVWQRAGEIFYTAGTAREVRLGPGKQAVAVAAPGGALVVWQQGSDLVTARVSDAKPPVKLASQARFAALVPLAGGGALLAYERGPAKSTDVVIERL